jgi:hypothetical protein
MSRSRGTRCSGSASWWGSSISSTVTFTWVGTGGIGVLIRGLFRRRWDRKADIDLLTKEGAQLKEIE